MDSSLTNWNKPFFFSIDCCILDITGLIARSADLKSLDIMDISVKNSNGVETIRDTLMSATKNDGVKISYMGAPKYRLSIISSDFKSAERAIKPVISKIQQSIEKKKGLFQFVREESKKTRDD